MIKAVMLITGGVLIITLVIYFMMDENMETLREREVNVLASWELPDKLKEVSGIHYLGNNLMACVQDEEGIIFIYDLEEKQIKREIKFAGDGDYEAITVAGSTAYILRSDGNIFEVKNFRSGNPVTSEIYSPGKPRRNFEGLEYDGKNNRLLLSIKERSGRKFRPVYAIHLETNQMEKDPAFRISFNDPIFYQLGKNPSEQFLRPSEIAIHPQSGKIYILEGVDPKLLILNSEGTPEELHLLSPKQFRQAEGLSFGPNGEIYISNEGKGAPPNILQISLN